MRGYFTAGLGVVAASVLALASPAAAQMKPPTPEEFATMAVQSDEFEILEGRTALAQSRNAQVRALAEMMIRDHGKLQDDVLKAARASGLPPPPKILGPDQAQLLGAAQSAGPADFDKVYVDHQALAHQQALTVQKDYAASGSDPNLKRAAAAAVPIIQHHLDMTKSLQSAMPKT